MKNWTIAGSALLVLLGTPLAAQDARFGVSLNLAVPTGGFSTTNYAADAYGNPPSTNSYDAGVGAQFLVNVPLDKAFALRFSLGAESFSGKCTSPYADSLNLQQQTFSLGVDAQFFLAGGDAKRQKGAYLLLGTSVDFEHYDSSYGDPNWDASTSTDRTRIGGLVGVGYTFKSYGGMRYLVEAAFHKTLTQTNAAAGDPPAADFLRFSFGFIL